MSGGAMRGRAGQAPDAMVITGGVFLGPAAAGLAARALQLLVQLTERRDGGQLPAELLAVMAQLQKAGELAPTDVNVRTPVDADSVGAQSLHELPLDAAGAAALLGCTPANVRDLARRGALDGRRSAGRWSFQRLDVLAYRETRQRLSADRIA